MAHPLIRSVRRWDTAARWVITLGGLLIIASVVGILVLIVRVTLPLFVPPGTDLAASYPAPPEAARAGILAIGTDDYLDNAYAVDQRGVVTFFDAHTGGVRRAESFEPPTPGAALRGLSPVPGQGYTLLWSDGSVTQERVRFRPEFDAAGRRTITAAVERQLVLPPEHGRALLVQVRTEPDGPVTRAALLTGNRFEVVRTTVTTDLFGNEQRSVERHEVTVEPPGAVNVFTLDRTGSTLYVGTDGGQLLRWVLREGEPPRLMDRVDAFEDGRAITALEMLGGNITLAVGDALGGLAGWFPVQRSGGGGRKVLRRIHDLRMHRSEVVAIQGLNRSRSLLSLDAAGNVHFDYATSERALLALAPATPLRLVGMAPNDSGFIGLDARGRMALWRLDMPHPEAGWKTFFGSVWYESYPAPEFVWQSSSGADFFEPKLSLVPLIFGTLKATIYGMLFAVPLGVLAAMYSSQLMHRRLRTVVKPAFEIMGSVPTVVIGFLAALWLAPILAADLAGFLLAFAFLPVAVLGMFVAWERLPVAEPLKRRLRGLELPLIVVAVVLAMVVALQVGQGAEVLLFGDNLRQWSYDVLGVTFDQRNSVVIAFALGFAVVPIVFTISDDALTNVPARLRAASLALGASRWQTLWRVTLPSAAPGVFAAVMVGFGRAIGETMIVLMATGNTPIMDWSPLNGMRTLAANIAVEVPEAPVNGTLYRTLFLCAVLLFGATFALNTVAEVVRQRLRRRFGRF